MAPLKFRTLCACVAALLLPPATAWAGDESVCVQAAAEAEQALQLPPGLLLAIGRVESGRHDPGSGRVLPWPWTINAAGTGQIFADLPQALARTQALLQQGVALIDVGCFQIDLAYHRHAFASLAEAFDPQANARYAAGFLIALHDRLGNWNDAIAAYHSATPAIGGPYRERVVASWQGSAITAETELAFPAALAVPALRVEAWQPTTQGVHVWKPDARSAANVIILTPLPALPKIVVRNLPRP